METEDSKRINDRGEFYFHGLLLGKHFSNDGVSKVINEMHYREDDIVVVTYPKSGTTLSGEILLLLMNDGDVEKCRKMASHLRTPFMEHHPPFLEKPMYYHLDSVPSPRVLKSHLPVHMLKRALDANVKIILVFRNPKDVLVSFFHHYKNMYQYNGGWDAFFELFKEDKLLYGSWFDHTLGWLERRRNANVYCTSFEALKSDMKNEVLRMAQFLGKNPSSEVLDSILKETSFNVMKSNDAVNFTNLNTSKHIRKGTIGDWKNHFSTTQSDYFDQLYKEKMKNCEVDFLDENMMKALKL